MRFRRQSAIAVDAGPASVAVCQLQRDRDEVRVRAWGVLEDPLRDRPTTAELSLSAERVARLIRQTPLRGREACVALKPPDVTFHGANVPPALLSASREQCLTPLRFEAARQMQCDAEEIEVDFWPLPPGNRSGSNVMIASVRRETIERWTGFFDSLGLLLAEVDALPCALVRAAWYAGIPDGDGARFGPDALWGVLDIGFGGATLTIAVGGRVVYVRPLVVSGDGFTLAIVDSLDIDYRTAESLKRQCGAADRGPGDEVGRMLNGLLRTNVRVAATEIERAFAYAAESYPQATPAGLYLCGGGAKLPLLAAGLQETLGVSVAVLDPCRGLRTPRGEKFEAAEWGTTLAGCVGAALGRLV